MQNNFLFFFWIYIVVTWNALKLWFTCGCADWCTNSLEISLYCFISHSFFAICAMVFFWRDFILLYLLDLKSRQDISKSPSAMANNNNNDQIHLDGLLKIVLVFYSTESSHANRQLMDWSMLECRLKWLGHNRSSKKLVGKQVVILFTRRML